MNRSQRHENWPDWKLSAADRKRLLTVPKRKWTVGRVLNGIKSLVNAIVPTLILVALIWGAVALMLWPTSSKF